MDIALYIADILKVKDEVSIPGIGTLYKKKSGAFYNPSEKTYSLANSTLLFAPEINNPNTLIDYIGEVKRISPASAEYFIEKFSDSLLKDLNDSGKAEIMPVGTFLNSAEGIIFNPASADYQLIEDYGLISVKDIDNTVSLSDQEDTASENFTSGTVNRVDEYSEEDFNNEQERKDRPPYIIAGIFVLIALAALTYSRYPETFDFLLKPANPKQENKNNNSPIAKLDTSIAAADTLVKPLTEADSIAFADSIMIKKAKDEGLDVEKARDTIAEVSTEVHTLPVKDSITYEVIGSTFWKKSEADNYLKFMRKKGIYTKVVTKPRERKFYISLGTFSDRAKANEAKRRIAKELSKEAWILELKTNTNP